MNKHEELDHGVILLNTSMSHRVATGARRAAGTGGENAISSANRFRSVASIARMFGALIAISILYMVACASTSLFASDVEDSAVSLAIKASNRKILRKRTFGLSSSSGEFDGSKFPPQRLAYMFYVTSDTYACAALHLMTRLVDKVNTDRTRIDLVVLHSPFVDPTMLTRLQDIVQATLISVDPILAETEDSIWQDSLTKLHVFRDWGYDRVVYLDADSVPMQNLDHLFALPSAPLYAPTAYWLPQPFFSSALMVMEPSNEQFESILEWVKNAGAAAGFDMDILNSYFKDAVQYLPGDYMVLNSDFRAPPTAPNKLYTTTTELKMHAQLVHFSCTPDGSYGKPWTWSSRDVAFSEGLDPLFARLFEDFWMTEQTHCNAYESGG